MKIKLPLLFAGLSTAFYLVCMVCMKNGAEAIIGRLIRQGNYDSAYHYMGGWGYDYAGVEQFLYATGIFLFIYYGIRIIAAIRGKKSATISAAVLASYIVCIAAIAISQFHLFWLILAFAAVFVGFAAATFRDDLLAE